MPIEINIGNAVIEAHLFKMFQCESCGEVLFKIYVLDTGPIVRCMACGTTQSDKTIKVMVCD